MRHKRVHEFALASWVIGACAACGRRSVPPTAARAFIAETVSRELCVQRNAAEAGEGTAAEAFFLPSSFLRLYTGCSARHPCI